MALFPVNPLHLTLPSLAQVPTEPIVRMIFLVITRLSQCAEMLPRKVKRMNHSPDEYELMVSTIALCVLMFTKRRSKGLVMMSATY